MSAPKKDRPKRRRPLLGRVGTWLGIAGVLGVAAGGVLVARDARQRQAYTPEQVRQRLHERAGRRAGEQ